MSCIGTACLCIAEQIRTDESLLHDAGKFEFNIPGRPNASERLPEAWAVALLHNGAGSYRWQLDGAPLGVNIAMPIHRSCCQTFVCG